MFRHGDQRRKAQSQCQLCGVSGMVRRRGFSFPFHFFVSFGPTGAGQVFSGECRRLRTAGCRMDAPRGTDGKALPFSPVCFPHPAAGPDMRARQAIGGRCSGSLRRAIDIRT